MTRQRCLTTTIGLVMAAFTAVHAETFSFAVGGHRVTISASHNCLSASCVAVAIPGIVTSHRKRSDDFVTAQDAAAAKPLPKAAAVAAPAPAAAVAPIAPVATRATVQPPISPPPQPSAPRLAAVESKEVAAPPPPPAEPVKIGATERPSEPPAAVAPPAPVLKLEKAVDIEREDSPLGDWQTEGKIGAVRIEACGKALCGYLINPS